MSDTDESPARIALDQVIYAQTLLIDACTDRDTPWSVATFRAVKACRPALAILRHELGLDVSDSARAGEEPDDETRTL